MTTALTREKVLAIMIDKFKEEALEQGMKLVTHPKVLKVVSDPRVIDIVSQGFVLKSKMQHKISGTLRKVAWAFNLATKEDVEHLRYTLNLIEDSLSSLERKLPRK